MKTPSLSRGPLVQPKQRLWNTNRHHLNSLSSQHNEQVKDHHIQSSNLHKRVMMKMRRRLFKPKATLELSSYDGSSVQRMGIVDRVELDERLTNKTELHPFAAIVMSFGSYYLSKNMMDNVEWLKALAEGKNWFIQYIYLVLVWTFVRIMITGVIEDLIEFRRMLPPQRAADPDSLFASVKGINVHYKRESSDFVTTSSSSSSSSSVVDTVLVHGFGANTGSWESVLPWVPYRIGGGAATALDLPGFGLTQRPRHLEAYKLSNSGDIINGLLDHLDQRTPISPQIPRKTLYVGHSMGALAAINAAVQRPDQVAGLVLVAPAITPLKDEKTQERLQKRRLSSSSKGGSSATTSSSMAKRRVSFVWNVMMTANRVYFKAALALLADVFDIFIKPFLAFTLRRLVRDRPFWIRGLSMAYHDPEKLTNATVFQYQRPVLVRDWDLGLLNFVRARVAPERFVKTVVDGLRVMGKSFKREQDQQIDRDENTALEKLKYLCNEKNVPLMLIHGNEDRLVPMENSKQIAERIPTAKLVQYENCGHVPHEEVPAQFLDSLEAFKSDIITPIDNK